MVMVRKYYVYWHKCSKFKSGTSISISINQQQTQNLNETESEIFFRYHINHTWFAFLPKIDIFILHDGKSNEALTFSAETQILPGLEVMLILLDIGVRFLSVCHFICQICYLMPLFCFRRWTHQSKEGANILELGSNLGVRSRRPTTFPNY